MHDIPVAIIGGGIVGLATAREFSSRLGPEKVALFEGKSAFGQEQSGRSSEVLMTGIYYEGLKAALCLQGHERTRRLCREQGIPLRETGQLIVAQKGEEGLLEELLLRAEKNGVHDVEQLSRTQLKRLEEHVEGDAALLCRKTATIDSSAYLQTLVNLNRDLKTHLYTDSPVEAIEAYADRFVLSIGGRGRQRCTARVLINAAGLYSDDVAKMVNPENSYEIVPVKGEYYQFHNGSTLSVKHNVYPVPWSFEHNGRTYYDFGIHLTPLTDGRTIRVGPHVGPAQSKRDYTLKTDRSFFCGKMRSLLPSITEEKLEEGQVGILAEEKSTYDFIIERDKRFPHCLHQVGIESPGLSSAAEIGPYSWKMMRELV